MTDEQKTTMKGLEINWATGGSPTPDGYKWLCGRHFAAYEAREEAQAALRREQDG